MTNACPYCGSADTHEIQPRRQVGMRRECHGCRRRYTVDPDRSAAEAVLSDDPETKPRRKR